MTSNWNAILAWLQTTLLQSSPDPSAVDVRPASLGEGVWRPAEDASKRDITAVLAASIRTLLVTHPAAARDFSLTTPQAVEEVAAKIVSLGERNGALPGDIALPLLWCKSLCCLLHQVPFYTAKTACAALGARCPRQSWRG